MSATLLHEDQSGVTGVGGPDLILNNLPPAGTPRSLCLLPVNFRAIKFRSYETEGYRDTRATSGKLAVTAVPFSFDWI